MKINILNKLTLAGCVIAGVGMTSCDDFLTITPTSQIVEEDFWKDKGDVENVVSACYTRLVQSDLMKKYVLWGEVRSDNFSLNTGTTWSEAKNLMNGNLQPTNSIFNWQPFYSEINYCNKVLAHGPEVVEIDESFSEGDWLPIKAEMVALRALSHFYLVRTFGEIPYVTIDYNNDSQDFLLAQSTQQQVLDSIILDLEEVKDYAMKDYGNTVYNKGRVTKKMIYTLLADVYLWRASKNTSADSVAVYGNQATSDYQKCIEYCDEVIEIMRDDITTSINSSGQIIGGVTEELSLEDMLISNDPTSTSRYSYNTGAYDYIFGSGNSQESIFELQFNGENNANTMLNGTSSSSIDAYFYDITNSAAGSLVCTEALFQNVIEPNTIYPSSGVFTKTDYRRWETLKNEGSEQNTFPLGKYSYGQINLSAGTGSSQILTDNTSLTTDDITYSNERTIPSDANWIVYRLSDVILMKAEAMNQLYSDDAHRKEAFELVRTNFKRSNPYAYKSSNTTAGTDSLNYENFSTQENLEALIMTERQREFVGEGKRWFDLVRYAQRKGSTTEMLNNYLGNKFADNKKAVSAKLSTIKSLFSPIYSTELRRNALLHQNSVWNTTETTSKTDNL